MQYISFVIVIFALIPACYFEYLRFHWYVQIRSLLRKQTCSVYDSNFTAVWHIAGHVEVPIFPSHPLPLYNCPHYNETHLVYEYNFVHRAVNTIEASGFFCTRRFRRYIYIYMCVCVYIYIYIYIYIYDPGPFLLIRISLITWPVKCETQIIYRFPTGPPLKLRCAWIISFHILWYMQLLIHAVLKLICVSERAPGLNALVTNMRW